MKDSSAKTKLGKESKISVTVDIVIFTIVEGQMRVLLVKRAIPPFEKEFALPGGFVHEDESLEDAARRELVEETGTKDVYLEQLYSFGDVGRDPRGRVVTVAYYALIARDKSPLLAGSDAAEAQWFPVDDLPQLAFDHERIVNYALLRLRNKLEYTTVGFELLPHKFTLSQLQSMYEAILGKGLDKRNFRRRIETLGLVKPLKEWQYTGRKPAQLYTFVQRK
jgi:8-oxo-dGTP diphosphatase